MTRPKARPEASCTEMFQCSPAAALGWKLNLIMTGVGATFVAVLGLVKWTVDRVEQVEARSVEAAEVRAAKVAEAAAAETRTAWRAELADVRRWLADRAKAPDGATTAQR